MSLLITCALCHTRYALTDDVLLERGRKLVCHKCNHRWYHPPMAPSEPEGEATNAWTQEASPPDSSEAGELDEKNHATPDGDPNGPEPALAAPAGGEALKDDKRADLDAALFGHGKTKAKTLSVLVAFLVFGISQTAFWAGAPILVSLYPELGAFYRHAGMDVATRTPSVGDLSATRSASQIVVAGQVTGLDGTADRKRILALTLLDAEGRDLSHTDIALEEDKDIFSVIIDDDTFRATAVEVGFLDAGP